MLGGILWAGGTTGLISYVYYGGAKVAEPWL